MVRLHSPYIRPPVGRKRRYSVLSADEKDVQCTPRADLEQIVKQPQLDQMPYMLYGEDAKDPDTQVFHCISARG